MNGEFFTKRPAFAKRTAIAALLALAAAACAGGGNIISEDTIVRSAEEQWTEILEKAPLTNEKIYQNRTKTVANRILLAAGEDPREWRVAVFDGDEIYNAFALPNKAIGVFTGIITISETDDQLAAVLGHEVAHVRLKHGEERVNRELAPRILAGVAQIPGEVVGVDAVRTAGAIAGAGVKAGTILPFNRNQELEADLEGLNYLAEAGYDPKEAALLWREIERHHEDKGKVPEFLSTHPSGERRIKRLEEAAAELENAS